MMSEHILHEPLTTVVRLPGALSSNSRDEFTPDATAAKERWTAVTDFLQDQENRKHLGSLFPA